MPTWNSISNLLQGVAVCSCHCLSWGASPKLWGFELPFASPLSTSWTRKQCFFMFFITFGYVCLSASPPLRCLISQHPWHAQKSSKVLVSEGAHCAELQQQQLWLALVTPTQRIMVVSSQGEFEDQQKVDKQIPEIWGEILTGGLGTFMRITSWGFLRKLKGLKWK